MTPSPAVDPKVESYLLAGFKSGWAAAMLTLAETFDAVDKDAALRLRRWANCPPPIQCADLSTPEGRAMKADKKREVVWMDRAIVKPGKAT